jgi:hypothetical protein
MFLSFLIHSLWIGLGLAAVSASEGQDPLDLLRPQNNNTREWCFYQKKKYHILPGQSFGILPKYMHETYLQAHCDQYFCKPNHGKGVFRCEPIE